MLPKLWGDVWAQLAGSNHRTSPASRATLPVARYHTPQNTKTAASVPLPSLTFPPLPPNPSIPARGDFWGVGDGNGSSRKAVEPFSTPDPCRHTPRGLEGGGVSGQKGRSFSFFHPSLNQAIVRFPLGPSFLSL